MAPGRFEVTVDDSAVTNALRSLDKRFQDLRPALERVADDFLDAERRVFASHGASGGYAWPAKADGTAASLVQSGRLMRSLTTQRAARSRRRITRNSVTVGTSHPLAHLHQQGTAQRYVKTYKGQPLANPRNAGRLPARPVVFVTETDRVRWRGYIAEYVTGTAGIGL